MTITYCRTTATYVVICLYPLLLKNIRLTLYDFSKLTITGTRVGTRAVSSQGFSGLCYLRSEKFMQYFLGFYMALMLIYFTQCQFGGNLRTLPTTEISMDYLINIEEKVLMKKKQIKPAFS